MSAYRTASNEQKAPCAVCAAVVPREEIYFDPTGTQVCGRCRAARTLERLPRGGKLTPGWTFEEDKDLFSLRMALGAGMFALFLLYELLEGLVSWAAHHVR